MWRQIVNGLNGNFIQNKLCSISKTWLRRSLCCSVKASAGTTLPAGTCTCFQCCSVSLNHWGLSQPRGQTPPPPQLAQLLEVPRSGLIPVDCPYVLLRHAKCPLVSPFVTGGREVQWSDGTEPAHIQPQCSSVWWRSHCTAQEETWYCSIKSDPLVLQALTCCFFTNYQRIIVFLLVIYIQVIRLVQEAKNNNSERMQTLSFSVVLKKVKCKQRSRQQGIKETTSWTFSSFPPDMIGWKTATVGRGWLWLLSFYSPIWIFFLTLDHVGSLTLSRWIKRLFMLDTFPVYFYWKPLQPQAKHQSQYLSGNKRGSHLFDIISQQNKIQVWRHCKLWGLKSGLWKKKKRDQWDFFFVSQDKLFFNVKIYFFVKLKVLSQTEINETLWASVNLLRAKWTVIVTEKRLLSVITHHFLYTWVLISQLWEAQ